MAGIIGIIASLTVLSLSLVITRLATTALQLTGLSFESASFQARSAFTGTGFTTAESEKARIKLRTETIGKIPALAWHPTVYFTNLWCFRPIPTLKRIIYMYRENPDFNDCTA